MKPYIKKSYEPHMDVAPLIYPEVVKTKLSSPLGKLTQSLELPDNGKTYILETVYF